MKKKNEKWFDMHKSWKKAPNVNECHPIFDKVDCHINCHAGVWGIEHHRIIQFSFLVNIFHILIPYTHTHTSKPPNILAFSYVRGKNLSIATGSRRTWATSYFLPHPSPLPLAATSSFSSFFFIYSFSSTSITHFRLLLHVWNVLCTITC